MKSFQQFFEAGSLLERRSISRKQTTHCSTVQLTGSSIGQSSIKRLRDTTLKVDYPRKVFKNVVENLNLLYKKSLKKIYTISIKNAIFLG